MVSGWVGGSCDVERELMVWWFWVLLSKGWVEGGGVKGYVSVAVSGLLGVSKKKDLMLLVCMLALGMAFLVVALRLGLILALVAALGVEFLVSGAGVLVLGMRTLDLSSEGPGLLSMSPARRRIMWRDCVDSIFGMRLVER
jgi:hypothetical protein